MSGSRDFLALLRSTVLFATAWAAIGSVVGFVRGASVTGQPADSAVLSFATMYALAGAIAGISTALLVSRAERGASVRQLSPWRVGGWGVLGGLTPALLFGGLGALAGASLTAILPLVGVGLVGGVATGLVAASATAAAKHSALRAGDAPRASELGAP